MLSFGTIEISQTVGIGKRLGSRVELERVGRLVKDWVLPDSVIQRQAMGQAQCQLVLDLLVQVDGSLVSIRLEGRGGVARLAL